MSDGVLEHMVPQSLTDCPDGQSPTRILSGWNDQEESQPHTHLQFVLSHHGITFLGFSANFTHAP